MVSTNGKEEAIFCKAMQSRFKMKQLDQPKYIVDLDITLFLTKERRPEKILIGQTGYIRNIDKRFEHIRNKH